MPAMPRGPSLRSSAPGTGAAPGRLFRASSCRGLTFPASLFSDSPFLRGIPCESETVALR